MKTDKELFYNFLVTKGALFAFIENGGDFLRVYEMTPTNYLHMIAWHSSPQGYEYWYDLQMEWKDLLVEETKFKMKSL